MFNLPSKRTSFNRDWVIVCPVHKTLDLQAVNWIAQMTQRGIQTFINHGRAAIDVSRNELAARAIRGEFESLLFIDSDIGFDPQDAIKLFQHDLPVVAGVYAKKGKRELGSVFDDATDSVKFGEQGGLYKLKYSGAGFLRIKTAVLQKLIDDLTLPWCEDENGGFWPWFMPMVVQDQHLKYSYLPEDYAFCERCRLCQIPVIADTTVRLWHWGDYPYGWEDAGGERARHKKYTVHFKPATETAHESDH